MAESSPSHSSAPTQELSDGGYSPFTILSHHSWENKGTRSEHAHEDWGDSYIHEDTSSAPGTLQDNVSEGVSQVSDRMAGDSTLVLLQANGLEEGFTTSRKYDTRKAAYVTYVMVSSTPLCETLSEVLQWASGMKFTGSGIEIKQDLLYGFLPALQQCIDRLDNCKQLEYLVSHIEKAYANVTAQMSDMVNNGFITFDLLWAWIKAREILVTDQVHGITGNVIDNCFRLDDALVGDKNEDVLWLHTSQLGLEGSVVGWIRHTWSIQRFYGTKRITDLAIYPLEYHPSLPEVKESLRACSEKFLFLAARRFRQCQYRGTAWLFDHGRGDQAWHSDDRQEIENNARIMVDDGSFKKSRPLLFPSYLIRHMDQVGAVEDWLLCTRLVRAFHLGRNVWGSFFVDNISEVQWSLTPFAALHVPQEAESIGVLLRPSHVKGPVLLFRGPPGVGKKSTAMAVAEELRKPLLTITPMMTWNEAEFLGHIDNGFRWSAIMVAEDVGLWLRARTGDLGWEDRVVSHIIDTLNRPRASMILISNQSCQLDSGIRQRIDLEIEFPELDSSAREAIWRQKPIPSNATLTDEDLRSLGRLQSSGSQISTAYHFGRRIAHRANTPLCFDHLIRFLPGGGQRTVEVASTLIDRKIEKSSDSGISEDAFATS